MKTIYDVKMALDPDLYVNMVREIQAERKAYQEARNKTQAGRKPRSRKNTWGEIFPACQITR